MEITGTGVRKAPDDDIVSLLVNVDGIDLDELNLIPGFSSSPRPFR